MDALRLCDTFAVVKLRLSGKSEMLQIYVIQFAQVSRYIAKFQSLFTNLTQIYANTSDLQRIIGGLIGTSKLKGVIENCNERPLFKEDLVALPIVNISLLRLFKIDIYKVLFFKKVINYACVF